MVDSQNRQNKTLTPLQKAQLSQVHAQRLRNTALDEAKHLFDQGDLHPYVEVLSKFHSYNFYNLLLILKQYPSATHLASYGEWARLQRDPSEHVLKQGSLKSLIELISPCTSRLPQSSGAITWQAIQKIDVSQTNLTNISPPSKGYLHGQAHINTLVSALCALLSEQHGISVLYEPPDPAVNGSGAVGYRDGSCLHCRRDAPQSEQLHWLCKTLVELSKPEVIISDTYKDYFCHLATGSLLRIWEIKDTGLLYLRKDAELIRSVPSELQPTFLSLLQSRVRGIEEQVHCVYQSHVRDREEAARIFARYRPDTPSYQPGSESSAP